MPRKLRRAKIRSITAVPMFVARIFATGDPEDADALAELDLPFNIEDGNPWWQVEDLRRSPRAVALWQDIGELFTDAWIAMWPGTRPNGWWNFDAPRWQRSDMPARVQDFPEAERLWAEPRRRLSGVGTPDFECLNVYPEIRFGRPVTFIGAQLVDYYSGRARDVHGKLISVTRDGGPFTGRAIDPDDPPRYESQASYLTRHNLFAPGERARLIPEDFEPETITLDGAADTPDARPNHEDR